MGYYCTVPQCTSLAGKTKNVKFHRFPRDVTMADKWNIILKRGKPYTKYSKVCSLHFTQGDYNVTTMGQWKTLSKDAVPSQNLPRLNPDGSVMVIRKSRTVKCLEKRKDSNGEKSEKWSSVINNQQMHSNAANLTDSTPNDHHDPNIAYRLQTLSAIASALPPQLPIPTKPKKQDAFMQTDPVQSEEDNSQPNNSYSEASDNSFNELDYTIKDYKEFAEEKKYETPKDYTKHEDYIPQTNEEYNKEAEKYALERKSHNSYEKSVIDYQKTVIDSSYQKIPEIYNAFDKDYSRNDYMTYQYQDSVELLRNQQHNLEMLQQQHRITENQNFFNENHIKQEIDINSEEEKFMYERTKDQLDVSAGYGADRGAHQQRLLEHLQHTLKQEPVCDNGMQSHGSPYYPQNGHSNGVGYYEPSGRPGPELLIAKQNALAAHTQLWQNTMKRPFFYSETPHYSSLHRFEDLTRILQ